MLQVREHASFVDARAWAPQWNSLLFASGRGDVFGTYEWMSCWWEGHAKGGMRLLLLSVWDGEDLVGVAPFMVRRSSFGAFPVRALEIVSMWKFAGSAASVLGTIDIVSGARKEEVARAVLEHLDLRGRFWDIVRFHPLPEDSALLFELEAKCRRENRLFVRRHVFDNAVLHVDEGLQRFRQRLSSKFRDRLRQSETKLRRRGALDYSETSSLQDFPAAWDTLMDIERRSWKWHKGIAINSAAYRGFYRELATRVAQAGWLRLGFLRLEGKAVAYCYFAKTGTKAVFLKTGYDDALTDCSAGTIAMLIAFERLAAEGVLQINLLSGDWDFKQKWQPFSEPQCEAMMFNRGVYAHLLHMLYFRLRLYEKGRVPTLTFKRILRKCGIPWPNSELTRSDQLWFPRRAMR